MTFGYNSIKYVMFGYIVAYIFNSLSYKNIVMETLYVNVILNISLTAFT